jgi:hypothetical protein
VPATAPTNGFTKLEKGVMTFGKVGTDDENRDVFWLDEMREHGINPTVRQGGKHLKVEFDLDGKRPRGGCGEGGAQLVVSDQSYLQGMAGRAGRHVEKAEENEMNESKRLCVYTHSANGQIFLCNQKQSEENEHEKVIACCNNPFVLRRAEHGKIT